MARKVLFIVNWQESSRWQWFDYLRNLFGGKRAVSSVVYLTTMDGLINEEPYSVASKVSSRPATLATVLCWT
jgi:hypothetical protein